MKVILVFLMVVTASAHDIITTKLTFTRDVSRVFVRRCLACHSSAAAIPLATYEQARPWAVAIKEQVLSRQMPPWGAVKGFGHLSPDEGLTQEEILLIAAWVIGGAPKGDPALLAAATANKSLVGALRNGPVVTTKLKVESPLTITAIRPLPTATVDSARIVISYPDGHVEPLLWLYHYQPDWQRTFHFREPITVPAGALVESGSPLRFALEVRR